MKHVWLFTVLGLISCGDTEVVTFGIDKQDKNLAESESAATVSLETFKGDYSVFGECPVHDWNTGILSISDDYISITETGCEIASVSKFSYSSLLLELKNCHAEGDAVPDEKAKLAISGNTKTLQYLPNDDGVLSGDGRVFELTPCERAARE